VKVDVVCAHETDVERVLTGKWVILEDRMAMQNVCKMVEIIEVYE